MPRFLVVHKADYGTLGTMEHALEVARKLRASAPADHHWYSSWWDAEDEFLFCDWEAPDEESLRKTLDLVREFWTTEKVYPVIWMDHQWYA